MFALPESKWNMLQNLYNINGTHLTLGMLLHYLGELKIQIFCIYSADMEENANKLHFKCSNFNSSMHVTVCWVYLCVIIKILSSSLNIVDIHCSDVGCDEFSVPQIDRKSKQVKEQCHEKFYLQSVWRKTGYIKHRKYQNLWMNNKVWEDKNAICLHFLSYLLNVGRKFGFLISQGSVVTCLRWNE